jgi:hypothetical protein
MAPRDESPDSADGFFYFLHTGCEVYVYIYRKVGQSKRPESLQNLKAVSFKRPKRPE